MSAEDRQAETYQSAASARPSSGDGAGGGVNRTAQNRAIAAAPGRALCKVVVVDDSATMRALISRVLAADPRLHVVGAAADPYEARDVIKKTLPDVITLDIEMPRMDGLTFLDKIMQLRPMPVVMLSSGTQAGSVKAVEALARGAVDCVGKPGTLDTAAFESLADRVFSAASARVTARTPPSVRRVDQPTGAQAGVANGAKARAATAFPDPSYHWGGQIVLIGASTGGVDALEQVLGGLPSNAPPILITQHMPKSFLESFALRLEGLVAPRVLIATDGARVQQGTVYIAPGGETHLTVSGTGTSARCRLVEGPKVSGHRPSVDALFDSAVGRHGARFVAALLTGMGRDGAEAMGRLRQSGAHTIAQDEATSVVYGMPRVAHELGAVTDVVGLPRVAKALLAATARTSPSGGTA